MSERPGVYIRGAAVSLTWQDASKSLVDLIFAGVSEGLRDAQTDISAVDSVVLAAHDLVDGRSLSSMVTAPAAGAYLKDEIRLSDDGLAAMSLAAARVEAGESEVSIVAAWGRASEADFLATSRAAMDPFLQQPFGMSEFDVSAFRLARWLAVYPDADGARAGAAKTRRARSAANPRSLKAATHSLPMSYPLRAEEGPRWGDVVVAVIIGRDPRPIRVAGVGHAADLAQIGERDLLGMAALRDAAGMALGQAGAGLDDMSVIEVDGLTLSDEALALEALGLCPRGSGFAAYTETPRFNPSGGGEAGWCYPAMGLVRLAECYFRLRDAKAATAQKALAVGVSPFGGQTTTAMVLEAA